MKNVVFLLISIIFMGAFIGCSEEAPSVRVYNERSTKANVQIKSSTGNTINLNDVEAGQTTVFQNVTEGGMECTAVIQSEAISPTIVFNAANDYNYTIVVGNTTPPTLRIDTESK